MESASLDQTLEFIPSTLSNNLIQRHKA